jgi:FkbM family methyltransferase
MLSRGKWVHAEGVEDLDFDTRFRQDRLKRWLRGVRNGMNPLSLVGVRSGLARRVRFGGVTVQASPNQATYRLIEDIWMRGEYDFDGYVPGRGWRVVDVGANVGVFAMLAANRGAQVVAYEPNPDTFRRLVANTAQWRVECHHAAVVGEPCGSLPLFLHPLRDTRNTLLGERGGVVNTRAFSQSPAGTLPTYGETVEVPAVAISDVLAEPCDLLKIACEGGEFDIFAHVGDRLRNARRIVLELHTEMETEYGDAERLVAGVRDAGFDVHVHPTHAGMTRVFMTATLR